MTIGFKEGSLGVEEMYQIVKEGFVGSEIDISEEQEVRLREMVEGMYADKGSSWMRIGYNPTIGAQVICFGGSMDCSLLVGEGIYTRRVGFNKIVQLIISYDTFTEHWYIQIDTLTI